jgi:hypothetical protein
MIEPQSPSVARAIEGPITIASPDSAPNLRKNASDGGKDRGALQFAIPGRPGGTRGRFQACDHDNRADGAADSLRYDLVRVKTGRLKQSLEVALSGRP